MRLTPRIIICNEVGTSTLVIFQLDRGRPSIAGKKFTFGRVTDGGEEGPVSMPMLIVIGYLTRLTFLCSLATVAWIRMNIRR